MHTCVRVCVHIGSNMGGLLALLRLHTWGRLAQQTQPGPADPGFLEHQYPGFFEARNPHRAGLGWLARPLPWYRSPPHRWWIMSDGPTDYLMVPAIADGPVDPGSPEWGQFTRHPPPYACHLLDRLD